MPVEDEDRFVHEAVYFDATGGLVDVTAPVLRHALARGDDVALVCSDANNRALVEALGDDDRILVLPRPEIYEKAVTAVNYFRDFVRERVAAGAGRIIVVGEVGFATEGRGLEEWRRYEALLDFVMRPFPVRCVCGYDTRVLPEPVLVTGELTPSLPPPRGCRRRTPPTSTRPSCCVRRMPPRDSCPRPTRS